jgi:epoxyqueuosine reductase QueG
MSMTMKKEIHSLQGELEQSARQQGVDYFGVADLTPARDFIEERGGTIVAGFPTAVSIGMGLFDGLVDMVEPKAVFQTSPYIQHIYNVISPRLDVISLNLALMLRNHGHEAMPVPQGLSGRCTSILSYKLPAHLAGLGWIGKSCLLVTPDHGPRVRFSTVLTNAPLEPGRPLEEDCGDCTVCVDACPVKAFTGRGFLPDEPREARFDATKCEIYRGSEKAGGAEVTKPRKKFACGICVKVCPYGDPREREDLGRN